MADTLPDVAKKNAVEKVRLPQVVNVQDVLDIMSSRAANAEPVEPSHFPGTRAAKRGEWAVPRQLTDLERGKIVSLASQVGLSALPDEPRDLTQDEIDSLAIEARVCRDSQDVVDGRYEAIRTTVFNALNVRNEDEAEPEFVAAELYSPDNGIKFVREIRGGKPIINWLDLDGIVSPKVWDKIARRQVVVTTTYAGKKVIGTPETYEQWYVDEDAALACIQSGEITLDQIAEVTTFSKKTAAFHVKDMKEVDFQVFAGTAS